MMRLLCNGVALDLYEDAGLQFKKQNSLFAFGDMSSERTTQFKLPCTPTNDKAFDLARIPAYEGSQMRKQFQAQLQNGAVVMDGFLYISEFDGKDYAAIFVGGLAYDLKDWNNSKWGELLLDCGYGAPGTSQTYNANDADIPMIARVKYHFDNEDDQYFGDLFMGSIHLEQLFTALTTQGIFKITGLVGSNMRIIRNDKYGYKDVLERLANIESHSDYLELQSRNQVLPVYSEYLPGSSASVPVFYAGINGGMEITFPANTPENLCIVYPSGDYQTLGRVRFIGSRKFDFDANGDPYYYGEPLAGQTIKVDQDYFLLMDASGAHPVLELQQVLYFNFEDGGMGNVPEYDISVRVSFPDPDGDEHYPDYNAINDHSMLTDLSLSDLLQAYAAVTGRLVCVRNDGSVEFVQGFGNTTLQPSLIERKNVKRTFSDWAQRNFVQFKDTDSVGWWEKLDTEYAIDNVNLDDDKTLLEMAFMEGGQYPEQEPPFTNQHPVQPIPRNCVLYIRDTKEGYWGFDIPDKTIALADTETYLQRVGLPKITLLQNLCDNSTQFKAKAWMTFDEFYSIDGDTTFLVDNIKYTWTEASWQKNNAELTLQRI